MMIRVIRQMRRTWTYSHILAVLLAVVGVTVGNDTRAGVLAGTSVAPWVGVAVGEGSPAPETVGTGAGRANGAAVGTEVGVCSISMLGGVGTGAVTAKPGGARRRTIHYLRSGLLHRRAPGLRRSSTAASHCR